MASFWTRVMTAIRAFREAYVTAEMEGFYSSLSGAAKDFESYEARATRYAMLWAFYQGNQYRDINAWARKMKSDFKLYSHIRDVYNPTNRVCTFYQIRTWGGPLDLNAGDSSEITSALPIINASDEMRAAIAQLWRWSRWAVYKDIVPLYGAVYGDVFLRVVNDPEEEKLYLERIHPGWIVDIRRDPLGALTFYQMTYMRLDPERTDGSKVSYTEEAELTDSGVVYRTYRDNKPYAWTQDGDEWVVEYPFIPMAHIQHNNVGLGWGWAEVFPHLSKVRELDDQASKLNDQVRKMVDAPWLFTGVRPGKSGGTITIEGTGEQNTTSPEISRDESPILYAHDPGARPHALVAELDISATLNNIRELELELERNFPELRTALGSRQRDVSGRALLLARQEAEDKAQARRVNYDGELERLHKMAAAMGGDANYEGFKGFSLENWDSEGTRHDIDPKRPVFKPHPTETLDQDRQMLANAKAAENVGIGLEIFLQDQQWDEDRIKQVVESPFYQMHLALLTAQLSVAQGAAEDGGDSGEDGDDEIVEGDQSGRGTPTTRADFNVSTLKGQEG